MKILFLCGENSCRSQMAEGLMRSMGLDGLSVYSAGVSASFVNPKAVMVMKEIGLDISGQSSKALSDLDETSFDLRITLCNAAKELCASSCEFCPISPPSSNEQAESAHSVWTPFSLHWKIDDPAKATGSPEEILQAFRIARDEIRDRIENLVDDGFVSAIIKHRKLMNNMADLLDHGLVAHDDHRRIFVFNRAMEKITGIPHEEALGMDCHKVFPPDGLCGLQCRFNNGPSKVREKVKYRVSIADRDGMKKTLKVTASPFSIEDDIPSGILALIENVTENDDLLVGSKARKNFHGIISASQNMRDIFNTVHSVAASDYPVLISGESGTGKELTARAVHLESKRKTGPFVSINCGALPENILESELFGHVRGAFTGAIKDKKGRFELADRGTLFLDEVGELTPAFQVKLLRVLEEGAFEKVGGEKSISVDVRIVSATNRDLSKMIKDGRFRQDLFYRLCVVPILLPALRERHDDIPHLVDEFLKIINRESGKNIKSVSDSAMNQLMNFNWPGNVRQLRNSLQFASIRCEGNQIEYQHLPSELHQHFPVSSSPKLPVRKAAGKSKKLSENSVRVALSETKGNKAQAAKLLGVGRATLYRFLAKNPDVA